MSTATAIQPPPALAPTTTVEPFGGMASLRRFTVDEYHAMIRAGVLGEEDPVELLEGYLVLKMPRGPAHDSAITKLNNRLVRMLPAGWHLRPQAAATMPDSEPEPDFAIVRGDESAFDNRHPQPSDVAVLIEIADSSVRRDTRDKARIYARAGILEYWVVNIPDRRIEVLTNPSGAGDAAAYATRTEYPVGTSAPVVLDGTPVGTIAVADVIR